MMRGIYAFFTLILPSLLMGSSPSWLILELDYLYWRPCSDSFFIAVQREIDSTEVSESIQQPIPADFFALVSTDDQSKIILGCDRPGSGTRLRVAFPCVNRWTMSTVWTQLSTTNTCHQKVDSDSEELINKHLIPFTGVPSLTQTNQEASSAFVDRIKGKWKLDLSMIDIGVGPYLEFGQCLVLHPHFDLRIGSMKQKLGLESEGQFFSRDLVGLAANNNFEGKKDFTNDFSGVGPRIGFTAEWNLFCGSYLFGHLAPSILYGHQTLSEDQLMNQFDATTGSIPSSGDLERVTRSKRTCSRAFVDISIGLGWDGCFLLREAPLHLAIGWDFLYAFNQNVADANGVNVFVSHDNHDVALQGLTLTLGVGF